MKRMMFLLISILLMIGCVQQEPVSNQDLAKQDCIELCRSSTLDLDKSPCLSNEITQDWVCDVAHDPREEIDNLPENQCSAFREAKAHHFIELDEDCNLIKIY